MTVQRRLYGAILRLHPASFRDEFGRQMARDFEDAVGERGVAPLLGDALLSLGRQWKACVLNGPEFAPEIAEAVPGHPFLAGQYPIVLRGHLTLFDWASASLLSLTLVIMVGFFTSIPNQRAIADLQAVSVNHDGGIDTGGSRSPLPTADPGRREAPEAGVSLTASGKGPFHGRLRLSQRPTRPGLGPRAAGGPPPTKPLMHAVRQLILISFVIWLTSFFLWRSSGVARKLALSVVGLLGIAAGVAFGQAPAPIAAQDSPTPIESYSVVSVRPSGPVSGNGGQMQAHIGDTNMQARNINLKSLIKIAYGLQDKQIVGGPAWIVSQPFDVEAKSDSAVGAIGKDWSAAQRKNFEAHGMLPLQNLLADRFELKVHFEERETSVYALVIAKGGSKLQPPGTIKEIFGDSGPGIRGVGPGQLAAIQSTTDQLARFLDRQYSGQLGRPIVNQTGLTAAYDFKLQFTPDQVAAGDQSDSAGVSLFTALQEQLGLKLESQKAPVHTMIIDHVAMPSQN